MGKGTCPALEKCYCVKTNSISEVGVNSVDTIGLSVCNHMLCELNALLICFFTMDASARFETGKPMLIVPRIYHIHISSAVKIVAASGHLEVKNCTEIYCAQAPLRTRWGAYSAPTDPLAGVDGDRSPKPEIPTPP